MIFVVDSNDRERIGEANDELHKMVSHVASYSREALTSESKLYANVLDTCTFMNFFATILNTCTAGHNYMYVDGPTDPCIIILN